MDLVLNAEELQNPVEKKDKDKFCSELLAPDVLINAYLTVRTNFRPILYW
jgi:hypothetical protein